MSSPLMHLLPHALRLPISVLTTEQSPVGYLGDDLRSLGSGAAAADVRRLRLLPDTEVYALGATLLSRACVSWSVENRTVPCMPRVRSTL